MTRLRFLPQSVSSSTFELLFRELCQYEDYGYEGSISLLQSCSDLLNYSSESPNLQPQLDLVTAIFKHLLHKPNFSTIFCEPLLVTSMREVFLGDLSNTLKLSNAEKVGVGLALSESDKIDLKIIDTKAWEVDTLRGHMNNVSCVMFHAKQDMIVSNSEDKSIQVWDATKHTAIQTFCREHDRFWILSAQPEMELLAAGRDYGMIVFKLERKRPAFSVVGDHLYYVHDGFMRFYEFSHQKDNKLVPIRRLESVSLNQGPRTLSFSPTNNVVLICSDANRKAYVVQDAKKGGGSTVFVGRNRFAVLDKSTNQALVKNLRNEIVKKSLLPIATNAIFYAGIGNLLCRAKDKVVIFDLEQHLILGELQVHVVKNIVWSSDMESIALLSKHVIVIANKTLVHRCTLNEKICVKSGVWDDNGVFIYTTLKDIKYCLFNGVNGIIEALDVPVYLTKVSGNSVYCLDRDGKNKVITIDSTKYIFKLALLTKNYEHVMSMINKSPLLNGGDRTLWRRNMRSKFEGVLDDKIVAAYRAMMDGKLNNALRLFLNVLYIIPIALVNPTRKFDQFKRLIEVAREYVLGLKIDIKRRETKDDVIRHLELAAYFTNCKLQTHHTRLVLKHAMTICFKRGNYATATHFGRMLLKSWPTKAQLTYTTKVLTACFGKRDAHQLNYDYMNPFIVCGATFVPIYRGQKNVSCPYCGARFIPSIQGQICTICDISVVGGPMHPVFASRLSDHLFQDPTIFQGKE